MAKNLTIAVLPGDGIGPEVIEQAIKVLDGVSDKYGHTFTYRKSLVGAAAIDKTGEPLPEDTLDNCMTADAVLLGAIGDQRFTDPTLAVRPEQGLLALRKTLGIFTNIRPVKAYDRLLGLSPLKDKLVKDVDFTIFRELTGGIYFGQNGRKEEGRYAFDICSYYDHEIERIASLAFEEARKRKNYVCLEDKANVLESSRLWRETVQKLHKDKYSDVKLDALYVDHAAMELITNPIRFDVILTSNLFGDILSDEGSVISGSLGLLPSASIGDKHCLFEPVHGSYPEAAGRDIANPIASILSVAMLLEHFGMQDEAKSIRQAIDYCMAKSILTEDCNPDVDYTCSQLGDVIQALVAEEEGINTKGLKEGSSSII